MPAALCATVGGSWLLLLVLGVTAVSSTQVFRVTDGGKPRSEIWVTPRVLAVDNELTGMSSSARRGELERRRLRDSVTDFVDSIEKMSGVRLSVVATDTHVPADKSRHILIGELAQAAFGSPQASVPGGQGFRVVIRRTTVGLSGESDLGTSYAIFEILHRLGCRWFMPGDLGEVIPARRTIELPLEDSSITPATYYRDLWYRDDAYARRNRLGGLKINAGHALERYITPQQRRENPKWLAQIDSQRDPSRPQLSWGNPEVAEAIATELIARLDEDYVESL